MKINLGKVFDTGGGDGRGPIVEALSVTENGTYKPNEGVDGFNEVNVNVPIPTFTTEELSATANGEYTPTTDGYSKVNVNVPIPTFTTEELSATANGTYTPTADGFSKVSVNVPTPEPNLQTKSIEIVENGTQIISADEGYDGLSAVEVSTNVPQQSTKLIVPNGMKLGYSSNIPFDLLDFSQVTDASSMFKGVRMYKIPHQLLEKLDTSNITTMRSMLDGAFTTAWSEEDQQLDLSGWNTSKVTDMAYMLYDCSILKSLNLSGWNTSAVTTISSMFENCRHLTSLGGIENFDTSKVTRMDSVFSSCENLTSLDLSNWNTSSVIETSYIFSYCTALTSLDLSNWDTSKVTSISSMFGTSFSNLSKLTNLNMTNAILPKINLTNWGLNYCTALTVESLVSVLNALPQLDAGQSFTCTIGSTNLAKLSDEQKSIATNKGWTLN